MARTRRTRALIDESRGSEREPSCSRRCDDRWTATASVLLQTTSEQHRDRDVKAGQSDDLDRRYHDLNRAAVIALGEVVHCAIERGWLVQRRDTGEREEERRRRGSAGEQWMRIQFDRHIPMMLHAARPRHLLLLHASHHFR